MEGFPIVKYTAALATQVHEGRAILYSLLVSGDAADGDAQIYDGMGTGGDQLMHVEVANKYSFQWKAAKGIAINKGIHLVANATTTKCTVEYLPID